MEGNCLAENILYLAKIDIENRNNLKEEKMYIGATENECGEKGTLIIG